MSTLTPTTLPAAPARRGARLYFISASVAQLCALVRYTVLVRLLGPEQLGLAATLILTSQFFEQIVDTGSDRFLIQDKDGDTGEVQNLVQLVFVVRGAFVAATLVLFSGLIAAFYKTPQLAVGIAVVGISPLLFGFLHLDLRRAQRHNDFRSEGVAMLAAESLSLVVTVVAAVVTRDFTASLYGLITRSLVMVVVSHLRSHRPYRLGFSREHAGRLARFAAPLMLNGFLIFFGSQGDRILVANRLGLTELGQYSAVLLLIFYPSSVLIRYVSAMHLPRIAANRGGLETHNTAADLLGGQALILSVMMCSGFAVVAPLAIKILYGSKFAQPALVICLIGILQSSRFVRLWPNTVSLGMGRSGIILTNNVVRLIGLAAALFGVNLIGGLAGVTGGFILGELAALFTAIVLVNGAAGNAWWRDLDRFVIFISTSVLIIAWASAMLRPISWQLVPLVASSMGLLGWVMVREAATLRDAIDATRRALHW